MAILTVGSLFSGIGGFCRGFQEAGFEVAWANDADKQACKTYEANFDTNLIGKDVTDLSVSDDNLESVDVLTAGFPCQPFSIAGEQNGFDDHRGNLFFEITRLVREFGPNKPKIIVLENVKNFLKFDDGNAVLQVTKELRECGYWFGNDSYQILDTAIHTTIPQNRERLFMVALSRDAFKRNYFSFPKPVAETLPVPSFLDRNLRGEDWLYFTEDSQYYPLFVEEMKGTHEDDIFLLRRSYVRHSKRGLCFTLMANMGGGGHNVPVIRDNWGIRKLSPRECARLQGFSDDWFKIPADTVNRAIYQQIGNAVTVDLSKTLAGECARVIQEHSSSPVEDEPVLACSQ